MQGMLLEIKKKKMILLESQHKREEELHKSEMEIKRLKIQIKGKEL